MGTPKISVCIPTYNYGRYISQAMESVLCQSFTDFELLVVDDCSNDSTDEVVRRYARQDSRIRYIRHQTNLGMVQNWNYCLRQANGKYIKFMFGDDFFVSVQSLEKMLSAIESDESISLVSSARMVVNDKSVKTNEWGYCGQDIIVSGFDVICQCLLKNDNLIGEPTAVMFKATQSLRGFNQQYRQIVDLEMWFHLLEQGRYAFLAEPLCAFRIHDQQQTAKVGKEVLIVEWVRICQEYLGKKYIKFGFVEMVFLPYDSIYQIWKLCYKQNELDEQIAHIYITDYGALKFYLLFPIYKIYKPLRKLYLYIKCNLFKTRFSGSDRSCQSK